MMILRRLLPILLLAVLLAGCGSSQEGQSSQEETSAQGSGDAASRTVAATEAFLGTLDDAQREQATFDFDDDEAKANWSNFPVQVVPRNGVALRDMTEEQQQAALEILQAALSEEGYQKTIGNMVSDQANLYQTGESEALFGAGLYYFAVFGTPSETEPWMLQYGGHHYAINLTVSGEDNVFTPSFTGVQPSEYTLDEAADLPAFVPTDVLQAGPDGTIRPMADENDLAFELINALDAEQQEQAILSYEVSNLVLGPGEDGRVLEPEGIPASEMTADQPALLLDLVRQWVGIANEETAQARMSEIQDDLNETYFAWSGPTTNGESAYYRVTGPTLHIEFAHQDDGGPLHIHSVYRDPTREYGEQSVA